MLKENILLILDDNVIFVPLSFFQWLDNRVGFIGIVCLSNPANKNVYAYYYESVVLVVTSVTNIVTNSLVTKQVPVYIRNYWIHIRCL